MDDLHAVKEAAIADVLRRFGLQGADAAKRVGTFLGTNHPSPGYGPGLLAQLRAWRQGEHGLGAALRTGLGQTAKNVGHTVGETARSALLGDPVTMAQDFSQRARSVGPARAFGQYAREYYTPSNLLNGVRQGKPLARAGNAALLGLNVGLPALQLYGAVRHPEQDQRGRAIGGAVAGLATAPFTARMGGHFGVGLGALAGQAAQRAGGAVGGLFDRPQPQPAPYASPEVGSNPPQGVYR